MTVIENLKKAYSGNVVLDIKSLTIDTGERLALTGANGSGKSTLLKAIAGVIAYEGKITAPEKILYMPQKNVCFNMSVLKNVTFSLSGSKTEKEDRAYEALKAVGLEKYAKKNALGLSGGEGARLCLARILAKECDLLLLDEPTGAVDIEGTEIIENAILDFVKKNSATLISVTHSPLQTKRLAKRVVMLSNGIIAEQGSPEEFLTNPSTQFGKKFVSIWRY